jgi:hypothetical protein
MSAYGRVNGIELLDRRVRGKHYLSEYYVKCPGVNGFPCIADSPFRWAEKGTLRDGTGLCSSCSKLRLPEEFRLGASVGVFVLEGSIPKSQRKHAAYAFLARDTRCGCCVAVRTPSSSRPFTGTGQLCSCSRRSKILAKDLSVPRQTRLWREIMYAPLCAFCEEPVHEKRRGVVDHVHGVCSHAVMEACPKCIRGFVHVSCNRDIATFDKYGWLERFMPYRDARPLLEYPR